MENFHSSESEKKEGQSEPKKEIYREIIGISKDKSPDMVLVLDAGIAERKTLGDSRWEPTSYEDETGNFPKEEKNDSKKYNLRVTSRENLLIGCGGGKARALAAIELGDVFPNASIVTDSRYPIKTENPPPEDHSKVYKEYLERMGVPKNKIQEEKESTTTFEGLINFLIMAAETHSSCPVIVTNDFHSARTKKMLELFTDKEKAETKLKYLIAKLPDEYKRKIGVNVEGEGWEAVVSFIDDSFLQNAIRASAKVVSAEEILMHRDARYKSLFDKARNTEAYQKRVKLEKEGVRQLEEGIYGMPKK